MTPTQAPPGLMTAEEFVERYDDAPSELVRGKVVPLAVPGSFDHGRVCIKFARYLDEFVEAHDLGFVSGNDVFVRVGRDPETVRGADVAYWPKDRVPPGPRPKMLPEPPALCAEVVSPTNTWDDIFTKTSGYHAVGVTVVVVLDPDTKIAAVYRKLNGDDQHQFKVGEDLTLPDVLPGFSVPVAKFFG